MEPQLELPVRILIISDLFGGRIMEYLQYIVEDRTIAELLGVQNFTNDEAAILELVKNAYDAKALQLTLHFYEKELIITDDGIGMNTDDIKLHWMHIGKSGKKYEVIDDNNQKRVLAGSKGIGRFALARLGKEVKFYTKRNDSVGVVWSTDWETSSITESSEIKDHGTKIVISNLRERWNERKVRELIKYLSKTYNDTSMTISVIHPKIDGQTKPFFPEPKLGINCLSYIYLSYNSKTHCLSTKVLSDEFLEDAQSFCTDINITNFFINTDINEELKNENVWDLSKKEMSEHLTTLGDFTAHFYFNHKSTKTEAEKFLYKYSDALESIDGGIILYRNAFSISSFEGEKDWLDLNKRSRKSPAAASHPTGAWRVRANQLTGKVIIDKKNNNMLQDLSNRQGLDENLYFCLFVEIILVGIKEFERYRQSIIRAIDKKNKEKAKEQPKPIIRKVMANHKKVTSLSEQEAKQLVDEIRDYQKESIEFKNEKDTLEKRYKYDVRILNVLSTTGLKASSIAHEMKNDRNSISVNIEYIIDALKSYGLWDELNTPERTKKAYKNVPNLLKTNQKVSKKILTFMDTMLSEIEKKQFIARWQSISDIINHIKTTWERDYASVSIFCSMNDDICFNVSEDILQVILDNLILNSIQQNESKAHLNISITVNEEVGNLHIIYRDDGKGLDKKYVTNPRRILDVHETTRKNGHGLGMWIVNNTILMSEGEIISISSSNGFAFEFTIGGKQ